MTVPRITTQFVPTSSSIFKNKARNGNIQCQLYAPVKQFLCIVIAISGKKVKSEAVCECTE